MLNDKFHHLPDPLSNPYLLYLLSTHYVYYTNVDYYNNAIPILPFCTPKLKPQAQWAPTL